MWDSAFYECTSFQWFHKLSMWDSDITKMLINYRIMNLINKLLI